jgi:DNA-binding CsgD family transcriptional regulator/tetratricopeptide (TPR) repeat protein
MLLCVKCPALVSRAHELEILGQAVDDAAAGSGHAVLLTGEPGIGKSRTVAAVTTLAEERGLVVLSGRAVRAVTPTPLRPLSQAVLAWLRSNDLPDSPEINPFRPSLTRLAPQLAAATAGGASQEQATSLVLLGEGLLRLLGAIGAGRGLVLVVEDLHWADPESMVVLEYLADNLGDMPILLLTTTRPLPPSAQESMESLAVRGALTMMTLQPLDDEGVGAVVRGCLGGDAPAELVTFIRDNAAGLPLLVEELVTEVAAAGVITEVDGGWQVRGPLSATVPPTFARAVQQRLSALPVGSQRVARAAALLGGGFDWAVLPAALGYDESAVLDSLRQLVARQIVVAEPDGFDFRHALTREAVRASMLPPEQAELAAHLAAGLVARAASPGEALDHQVAADLYELAGQDEPAAAHWLAGAREALGRGALATALETLTRGQRLVPSTGETGLALRETAVDACSLAGDNSEALAVGRGLLADLEEHDPDPARLARVRLRMARAAWSSGAIDEAEGLLVGAEEADPAGAAVIRAGVELGRFRLDEAIAQARQALAAAGDERPDLACEAWDVIGRTERGRDILESESAYEQGYRIAERHGLGHWRSRMLTELAGLDAIGRRPTEDRLHAARAVALETGALATVALVDWHLNVVRLRYHDVDGAIAASTASIEQMGRLRLPLLGPSYLMRAFGHGLAGRYDEMEADIVAARRIDPDSIVVAAGEHAHVRAPVALAHARYEDARRGYALGMEFYREHPGQLFSMRGMWALLETVLGDGGDAREEVRAGEQATSPNNWFALRYADAVAAGRAGDKEGAERIFADAGWTLPGREPWMEHHLRALVARAAAADGWGEPALWFRQALDGMVDVGQTEAASSTRAAMRDAGIPVPRRGKGEQRVPAHLQRLGVTAREYDVLELVVQGLTNQAIAGRLFLSARTVEVHVGRLLQRTGAATRTELATHLAE